MAALARLVRFSAARDTPEPLLRALREIDPAVELVCVGENRWWLGSVSDNEYRRDIGRFIKKVEQGRDHPNPWNLILADLTLQGFAKIEEYQPIAGDPAGPCKDSQGHTCTIVEDFRERDFAWRKDQGKAAFWDKFVGQEERARAEQVRIMRDKMLTDGRAEWRRVRRSSVTVGYTGD